MVVVKAIVKGATLVGAMAAADILQKKLREEASKANEHIQDQGGYRKFAADSVRLGTSQMKSAYHKVGETIDDAFYTDGRFDSEKARETISALGSSAKDGTDQALDGLAKLVQIGDLALQKQIYKFIPTQEELSTKYVGISRTLVLKKSYEKCLAMHNFAQSVILDEEELKQEVVADIKLSGSKSPGELIKYYINAHPVYSGVKITKEHEDLYRKDLDKAIIVRKYLTR